MKQFNLTPGDSRDYLGVRVRVEAVDQRKQGKPIVSLSATSLDELVAEGPGQPTADSDSDSEETTE